MDIFFLGALIFFGAVSIVCAFRAMASEARTSWSSSIDPDGGLARIKREAEKKAEEDAEYARKMAKKSQELRDKREQREREEQLERIRAEMSARYASCDTVHTHRSYEAKPTWMWKVIREKQLREARTLHFVMKSYENMVAEFESSPDRETGEIVRYTTTLRSCQCKDFYTRNTKYGPCKHILALALYLRVIDEDGKLLISLSPNAYQSVILNAEKTKTDRTVANRRNAPVRDSYLTLDEFGKLVASDEYGNPLQSVAYKEHPASGRKTYFDGKLVAFAGHMQNMTQTKAAEELVKRGARKASPANADILVIGANPPAGKVLAASKGGAVMISDKEFIELLS